MKHKIFKTLYLIPLLLLIATLTACDLNQENSDNQDLSPIITFDKKIDGDLFQLSYYFDGFWTYENINQSDNVLVYYDSENNVFNLTINDELTILPSTVNINLYVLNDFTFKVNEEEFNFTFIAEETKVIFLDTATQLLFIRINENLTLENTQSVEINLNYQVINSEIPQDEELEQIPEVEVGETPEEENPEPIEDNEQEPQDETTQETPKEEQEQTEENPQPIEDIEEEPTQETPEDEKPVIIPIPKEDENTKQIEPVFEKVKNHIENYAVYYLIGVLLVFSGFLLSNNRSRRRK